MDNAVLMEIERLRRASLAGLREKFREVFQEEARTRHREHLFRRIAWRLQALAEGDLTERARGRAREIAQDADLRKVAPRDFFSVEDKTVQTTPGDRDRRQQDRRLPLPGAMLSRKWKGRTILVEVLAKGFQYENRHYTSLSAIAVATCGPCGCARATMSLAMLPYCWQDIFVALIMAAFATRGVAGTTIFDALKTGGIIGPSHWPRMRV
jgi:hypothetical protein